MCEFSGRLFLFIVFWFPSKSIYVAHVRNLCFMSYVDALFPAGFGQFFGSEHSVSDSHFSHGTSWHQDWSATQLLVESWRDAFHEGGKQMHILEFHVISKWKTYDDDFRDFRLWKHRNGWDVSISVGHQFTSVDLFRLLGPLGLKCVTKSLL